MKYSDIDWNDIERRINEAFPTPTSPKPQKSALDNVDLSKYVSEAFQPTIVPTQEKPTPTRSWDNVDFSKYANEAFNLASTISEQPEIQPQIQQERQPVTQPTPPATMEEINKMSPSEYLGQALLQSGDATLQSSRQLLDIYSKAQGIRKQGVANILAGYRQAKGQLPSVGKFAQAIELHRKETGKDYLDVPSETYWDKFMRAGGVFREPDINLNKNLLIQLNSLYMNGKIPPPDVIQERLGDELGNQVIEHMNELSGGRFTTKGASWRWRGENNSVLTAEELMQHPTISMLFNAALDETGKQILHETIEQATNPIEWYLDYTAGKLVLVPGFKALNKVGFMRKPITRLLKTGTYNPVKIRRVLLDDLYRSQAGNDVISQVMNLSDEELMNIGEALKTGRQIYLNLPARDIGNTKGWKPVKPNADAQYLDDLLEKNFARQQVESTITKGQIVSDIGREAPTNIATARTLPQVTPGPELVPSEVIGRESINVPRPELAPSEGIIRQQVPERPIARRAKIPKLVPEEVIDTEIGVVPFDIETRQIVTQSQVDKILASHDEEIKSKIKDMASSMYQQGKQMYGEAGELYREIMPTGINQSAKADFPDLPAYIIRKDGKSLDEFAQEMDYAGGDREAYARILKMDKVRKNLKSKKLNDYVPEAEKYVMSAEQAPELPEVTPIDATRQVAVGGRETAIPAGRIQNEPLGVSATPLENIEIGQRVQQASTGFRGTVTNVGDDSVDMMLDNGIRTKVAKNDLVGGAPVETTYTTEIIPREELAAQTGYTVEDIDFMRSQDLSDADILARAQTEIQGGPRIPEAEISTQQTIQPSQISQNQPVIQPQSGQQAIEATQPGPRVLKPSNTIQDIINTNPTRAKKIVNDSLKSQGFSDDEITALDILIEGKDADPSIIDDIVENNLTPDDIIIGEDGSVMPRTKILANSIDDINLSEAEFIDKSPPIGNSLREIVPPDVDISEIKEPSINWFDKLLVPPRIIAARDPVANRILKVSRDTVNSLNIRYRDVANRIDDAFKGLNKAETEELIDYLEKTLPVENIPEKLRPNYEAVDSIRKEFLTIAQEEMNIATEQWGMSPDEYWPHIWVGRYKVYVNGKNKKIVKSLDEGLKVIKELRTQFDNPKFAIKPVGFDQSYSPTLLSRKGFHRFINEVEKATELDHDEIMSMMRGVAAIKPRAKFVGNFKHRDINLGGYMKSKDALKIYASRVLRKRYLDPYRKEAYMLAENINPVFKDYFEDLINDVSGSWDLYDNSLTLARAGRTITNIQSRLKLGYRPVTAAVNRFQPLQQAYGEIGHYVFRGNIFKRSQAGRRILQASGVYGELPKYTTGSGVDVPTQGKGLAELRKPLGLFGISETANHEDVVAGGYLFARKVFNMPREKAERMGYGYILDYLDETRFNPNIHTERVTKAQINLNKFMNLADDQIGDIQNGSDLITNIADNKLLSQPGFGEATENIVGPGSIRARKPTRNISQSGQRQMNMVSPEVSEIQVPSQNIAKSQGLATAFSPEELAALEYAKDLDADTIYIYGMSDLPKVLRTRPGRVAFQFRNFPVQFMATTYKWTAEFLRHPTPHNTARMARLVAMNTALAGVRGIPYLGRKAWKFVVFAPIVAAAYAAKENKGIGETMYGGAQVALSKLPTPVRETVSRGIFNLMGIDLSQRLGPGEFVPSDAKSVLGPMASDAINVGTTLNDIHKKGWKPDSEDISNFLRVVPGMRDLYRAYLYMDENKVVDPAKRKRMIKKAVGFDVAIQALGVPNERIEVERDFDAIIAQMEKMRSEQKQIYVDRIVDKLSGDPKGDPNEIAKDIVNIYSEAINNLMPPTSADIAAQVKARNIPHIWLRIMGSNKMLRPELMQMFQEVQKMTGE